MKKHLVPVLLLAGALITGCGGESPKTVTEKFLTCTFNGDTECVQSLVYTGDAPQALAKLIEGLLPALIKMNMAEARLMGGVEKISCETLFEKGVRAEVEYTVTFKDGGTSKKDRAKLTKTEKGWRIRLEN